MKNMFLIIGLLAAVMSASSGESAETATNMHPRLDRYASPPKEAWKVDLLKQPIRAYCIDFNWEIKKDGNVFPEPGHWADADPVAHVKWYKDIGANCIQTFVLSCNGYAWYKGGPVPEQPGLKHDFLADVVRLGHEQRMLVMGYYCIAANTLWGKLHPEQSYGTPSAMHIPLTKDYVDYLCLSVEDALKKTGMDGFMLDWMQNTSGKWLDCEKAMYAELMGVPFPGADKITPDARKKFDDLAVERCWTRIRDIARKVKPDCILWPNFLSHLKREGLDWMLNEGPDVETTEKARQQLNGRPIRLVQNQVGWARHDARKVFSNPLYKDWDFYGFAAPYENSLPLPVAEYLKRPIDDFKGKDLMTINDRNIAALIRFYLGKPVEPPPAAQESKAPPPAEPKEARDARMAWWREARFGMFVHWGLYSGLAGNWDGNPVTDDSARLQQDVKVDADFYAKAAIPMFKPKPGFAREWASLAKAAGCRYVVLTSKHHEGFSLHDSKVGDFDAGSVLQRDLLKEFVDACRSEGLRVGFYHSLIDWHHDQYEYARSKLLHHPLKKKPYPNGQRDHLKYVDYLHWQVNELVSNYGQVDILWWDYSAPDFQGQAAWRAFDLMKLVREKQPKIIINNRLFRSEEAGWDVSNGTSGTSMDYRYGDFLTPEQHILAGSLPNVDWESCMTINDCWGYTEKDHNWKSSEALIRKLVDIASKGGNLLLNIGPKGDGTVPKECVERMQEIGRWIKVNGEAIYGTSATAFGSEFGKSVKGKTGYGGDAMVSSAYDWRCTTKPASTNSGQAGSTGSLRAGKIYLHLFKWPADGKFEVPGLQSKVTKAYLLVDRKELKVEQSAGGVTLSLPAEAPDKIASVICLEIADQQAVVTEAGVGPKL